VNAHGGVNGRKIVYKVVDDAYDPSKTVVATQQLVEQDKVLAIFNSVGTEQNVAIRDYLNQRKVPQLFVGSGASQFAKNARKTPYTMGFLPSFAGEGAVDARWLATSKPKAKIAVLYEDSDYGHDLFGGLKKGLGSRARQIVATQTYEVTDVDMGSQVAKLKASGADTFVVFALPKQAIQAFVSASKLGWKPQYLITAVSIDPFVMKVIKLNAGARAPEGAVSTAFLHDATNPTQQRSKGVVLYKQIMKRYAKGADPTAVAHIYGMAAAYTMVDALRHAGKSPTRESLLRAAQHLDEANPFLLDGIRVKTSPHDYYPIGAMHVVQYRHGVWQLRGALVKTG
jgi:ABC-type branched-subunit amino acid transport system substrate-binding protein